MSRRPYHFVFFEKPAGTGRRLRAKVHNPIFMPHSGIDVNAFIGKQQIAGLGRAPTSCPGG
jgi:hypothetical protein